MGVLLAGTLAALGLAIGKGESVLDLVVALGYLWPLKLLLNAFAPLDYTVAPDATVLETSWPYYPRATTKAVFGAIGISLAALQRGIIEKSVLSHRAIKVLFLWSIILVAVRVAEAFVISYGIAPGIIVPLISKATVLGSGNASPSAIALGRSSVDLMSPTLSSQIALPVSPCEKVYAEPKLDKSIRGVHWKVSTANHIAQAYFDQGVTQVYGFNYEDAMRAFRKAKSLDPTFAMASWGIALAAGPNINIAMSEPCGKLASRESTAAATLAESQFKAGKITLLELDLTHALRLRYAEAQMGPSDYAVAMRTAWDRFNPNENVGALYAESLMDLRPWGLFNVAKQPAIDTPALERVLRLSMAHAPIAVGANHFWIHTVEAGPAPSSSTTSADLLRTLVPGSGHLLHMPSHTYMLVGKYEAAFRVNGTAIAVDKAQYAAPCVGTYEHYAKNPNCLQLYYGHYGAHNLFFRSVAAIFAGKSAAALKNARETREHAQHFIANEPELQRYATAPLMTLVANGDWKAMLREPEPPTSCYVQPPFTRETGCRILRATWRWGRGMAHAATGDVKSAKAEYNGFISEKELITAPGPTSWGNNSAAAVLAIANETLLARIAWAEGKLDPTIEHLKLAVTYEDALVYDEPPQWVHPSRQSLGGALLAMKNFRDARAAFTADLQLHPLNGRSLYGLARAVRALGNPSWSRIEQQYKAAWKGADYPMSDSRLW